MFLPSCCSFERFLTRRHHTQCIAILSTVLLCGVVSCAKPPRGTASIVGIRNVVAETSRPSSGGLAEQSAPVPTPRKASPGASRSNPPDSRLESPRALGTSGVSSADAPQPLRTEPPTTAATTTEPGAEATVGQSRVAPHSQVAGRTDAVSDERRIARLVAVPLGIMAIVGVIVVSRRMW